MQVFRQHNRTLLLASLLSFAAYMPDCANYTGQSRPAAPHKQSIAVYISGTEPPALKGAHKVIGSELAKALTESKAYSAVDRTEDALKIIEKEHIYQRSGAVDEKQIKELGKQLGVKFICIAEVSEVMGSHHLNARLVDVETAEVVAIVSKSGAMKDVFQVVETTKDTARELVGKQRKQ